VQIQFTSITVTTSFYSSVIPYIASFLHENLFAALMALAFYCFGIFHISSIYIDFSALGYKIQMQQMTILIEG